MDSFKVSAVIPSIGRVEYLDLAISSLLDQTVPFDEVLVFDNSEPQDLKARSKFGTDERVRWSKSGSQVGPIESWNSSVFACQYERVVMFGDDDIAFSNLSSVVREGFLQSDFVVTYYNKIDKYGEEFWCSSNSQSRLVSSAEFRYLRMYEKFQLAIPGVAFLKSSFQKMGGFLDSGVEKLLYTDDLAWFSLAEKAGYVYISGEASWQYRIHQNQVAYKANLILFQDSVKKYVDLLEMRLQGVSTEVIYGHGQSAQHYINKLISDRALIIMHKKFSTDISRAKFLEFLNFVFLLVKLRLPCLRRFLLLQKALRLYLGRLFMLSRQSNDCHAN